jgi:ketosteroid isomerase-like protein
VSDSPQDFACRARELVDTFAKGWSKGRVEMLLSVLDPQVIFLETPFSKPLLGIDAFRAWAADIPYHQSEARFTTGEVFVAGPWFSAEFKLTFRRRKTGETVDARGALFAETDGQRITELRMYWHRWVGGRDTALP